MCSQDNIYFYVIWCCLLYKWPNSCAQRRRLSRAKYINVTQAKMSMRDELTYFVVPLGYSWASQICSSTRGGLNRISLKERIDKHFYHFRVPIAFGFDDLIIETFTIIIYFLSNFPRREVPTQVMVSFETYKYISSVLEMNIQQNWVLLWGAGILFGNRNSIAFHHLQEGEQSRQKSSSRWNSWLMT